MKYRPYVTMICFNKTMKTEKTRINKILSMKYNWYLFSSFSYSFVNFRCSPHDYDVSAITVDIHLVLLQVTIRFGFICATIDIAMVPNYSNIVDITLVPIQVTNIFGFIFATINTAMVPNYSNIMLICHVILKMILPG